MPRVYLLGFVAAIAIAWLSAVIHASGRAPLGLTSIAVGAVLGIVIANIAASQRLAGAPRTVLAALLLSIVTILAQHAWLYREYRRQWHDARTSSPHAMLFRSEEFQADKPLSPREYVKHEATSQSIGLWFFDGALICCSATATAYYMSKSIGKDSPSRPTPTNDSDT